MNIPGPTLRRLPAYCNHLKRLQAQGIASVSCRAIGAALNLDSSQIRKDLETTGIAGKPKVGFSVPALVNAIEHFLGWDRQKNTVLAGGGSLGAALLEFGGFARFGLKVVGVFDADEKLIGGEAGGFEVRPLGFLPGVARALQVQAGIIALPARFAQSAAEMMVNGGVRAVWNLAPVAVRVPEGVFVENQDLYSPLALLSQRLAGAASTGATQYTTWRPSAGQERSLRSVPNDS